MPILKRFRRHWRNAGSPREPSSQRLISKRTEVETLTIPGGVRIQTRRVTHWQNGEMAMRWLASAFIGTEKRINKWIWETVPLSKAVVSMVGEAGVA